MATGSINATTGGTGFCRFPNGIQSCSKCGYVFNKRSKLRIHCYRSLEINQCHEDMAAGSIKKGQPVLFKNFQRENITQNSGANYWGLTNFPPKSGYSRFFIFRTNNANVVVTGSYFGDSNYLNAYTFNMSSSSQTFTIYVTLLYIRDDLQWS